MKFMDNLYRLKYIIRYSNYKRITHEDVAQHSFYVSSICVLLHNEYPKAGLGIMLLMATVHDWPEVDIDDVSHKVKRDFPAVAKALKRAEIKTMGKYPQHVKDAYATYEEQKLIEAQIVKLADITQCIQYLRSEAALGNDTLGTLLDESTESYFKLKGIVDDHYKRLYS